MILCFYFVCTYISVYFEGKTVTRKMLDTIKAARNGNNGTIHFPIMTTYDAHDCVHSS